MSRFERAWRAWDHRVRGKDAPSRIIATLSDEEILELLAGGDLHRRRYEMDVLAIELMNRLRRLRERLAVVTEASSSALRAAQVGAYVAEGAARESERVIAAHLETRRDRVAMEPEAAHVAAEATRRVRAHLQRVEGAHETLRALDEEARRRSRDHE